MTNVSPNTTKTDRVIAYLTSGRSLTQLEAISLFSLFRLSSVILNLRRQGFNIKTNLKVDVNGTEYAEYALVTKKYPRFSEPSVSVPARELARAA
jgi:hypothetical protein